MVDKIKKFLRKLHKDKRDRIVLIITSIKTGNIGHLDVKQLKKFRNVFRVRSDKIRILFRRKNGENQIISVSKRDKDTYSF